MITSLQVETLKHYGSAKEAEAQARRIAGRMFDQVYSKGIRSRLWAKLTGKAYKLQSLSFQPNASNHLTRSVVLPISKIVGTEGRSEDFNANFLPLKKHNRERWISVAVAIQQGVTLGAVELIQVGDAYYVRDGHHRISVAKAMGQMEIDAKIIN